MKHFTPDNSRMARKEQLIDGLIILIGTPIVALGQIVLWGYPVTMQNFAIATVLCSLAIGTTLSLYRIQTWTQKKGDDHV